MEILYLDFDSYTTSFVLFKGRDTSNVRVPSLSSIRCIKSISYVVSLCTIPLLLILHSSVHQRKILAKSHSIITHLLKTQDFFHFLLTIPF